MAEQEQERSEAATPFKMDEARKRGVVAKSIELNSTACVVGGLLAIAAFGTWMTRRLLGVAHVILASADQPALGASQVRALLGSIAAQVLHALSPVLAVVVIIAVLVNVLQSGPVFSATPLKPDFERLNPGSGLRRLFSAQTLFNGMKSILKLLMFTAIGFLFLRSLVPMLPGLYHQSAAAQALFYGNQIRHLLAYLCLGAVVIACADLMFTRWEFLRRMRMSRRELKDEVRRHEGDPQVRRRRRELQRELRRRGASLGKVKDADFLVTNPQHLAVAVRYRRGAAVAPEVTTKGTGDLALQMRALAFRHRVPIVPNPPLARALFREVRIGRPIAEKHYAAVAEILRAVYRARQWPDAQRFPDSLDVKYEHETPASGG